jgi:hypothetical protein
MYFNHAFRKTLLAAPTSAGGSTLLAATSGATSALTAGQLGIYDQNFSVIDYSGAGTVKPFYLVQGSYYKTTGYSDKIGAHGGYQESVKSKMINPKYISRIFWVQAKTAQQQVTQIFSTPTASGGNVGLTADTTYRLRIDVKGSPALRFLSHNIYRVLDSYTGPANATNPTYVKDPIATLLDWKEQITMSPYFNQLVQARVFAWKADYSTGSATDFTVGTITTTGVPLTIKTANQAGLIPGYRIVGSGLPAGSYVTFNPTSFATGTGPTTAPTASTTSVTITGSGTVAPSATITQGMYVTGGGLPAGAYVSTVSSQTNYVITYPTQTAAPTISALAALTFYDKLIIAYPTQSTAPTVSFTSITYKLYNDLYGANGGYTIPYTNIAVTSGQQPSYAGQATYVPGASTYNTSGTYPGLAQNNVATGATIAAASTVANALSPAHIYTASSDAASFTYTGGKEPFMELTAAYMETKFGNPTFTVTDNYDLEPLKVIASLMDDSGSTVVTAPIGQGLAGTASTYSPIGSIGDAGIAYVATPSIQAQGTGETVLRELILTGKYRQEAFGDGTNIDQFRMREIEANPGVLNMMTVANRNGLYNKLCILHNVPRFNNPSTTFDNDQYLIEIAVPNTVPITQFFSGATYSSGGTIAGGAAVGTAFGDYILESSYAAGGAQFAEMI